MMGCAVPLVVQHHFGSCFPILSFLHVPGKMTKPLWLMMGTAFAFQVKRAGEEPQPRPTEHLLLSAKHTFAPWDFVKDGTQLKIPKEFQKLRYVVAKKYHTDADGRAVSGEAVDLRLVSLHPTLDVALLAVDARRSKAPPDARCVSSGPPAEHLPHEAALELCREHHPASSDGWLLGFRGVGQLGKMDTLDPSLLQRLSPQEREALLKDLENVEGKQERAATAIAILDPSKGTCKGVGDLTGCYHGMSGGPLVTTTGQCAGVLFGHHPDSPQYIGYTPCAHFAEWLEGEIARYAKLHQEPSPSQPQ